MDDKEWEALLNERVTKEQVCDVIRWAEDQKHIKGDIECLIDNILDIDPVDTEVK